MSTFLLISSIALSIIGAIGLAPDPQWVPEASRHSWRFETLTAAFFIAVAICAAFMSGVLSVRPV